jgi:pimeloyl-ACP methyl ester carboxylesterase
MQPAYETKAIPHYQRMGGNGPTVVVLATDMQDTLHGQAADGVVGRLVTAGYQVLTLDLPCNDGEPTTPTVENLANDPLYCWSVWIHDGDTAIFTQFCAELSNVLSALQLDEVGIVGVSRGGYVATTCAAYEPRITSVVLIKPVTDLNYLSEFKQYPAPEALFSIWQYVPAMSHLPVLVRIGKSDHRVGTDLAVAFAREIHADLQLLDTVGHSAPEDGSTIRFFEAYLPLSGK